MRIRNRLMGAKIWVALDFLLGGWNMRVALTHYLDGELLWAVLTFIVGLLVIGAGILLLSLSLEQRTYEITVDYERDNDA